MKTLSSIVCLFSLLSIIGCSGVTVTQPTPEQIRLEVKIVARTGTYFAIKEVYKDNVLAMKQFASYTKNRIAAIDWNNPVSPQNISNLLDVYFDGDVSILFRTAIDIMSLHINFNSGDILSGDNLLLVRSFFDGISEGCDFILATGQFDESE